MRKSALTLAILAAGTSLSVLCASPAMASSVTGGPGAVANLGMLAEEFGTVAAQADLTDQAISRGLTEIDAYANKDVPISTGTSNPTTGGKGRAKGKLGLILNTGAVIVSLVGIPGFSFATDEDFDPATVPPAEGVPASVGDWDPAFAPGTRVAPGGSNCSSNMCWHVTALGTQSVSLQAVVTTMTSYGTNAVLQRTGSSCTQSGSPYPGNFDQLYPGTYNWTIVVTAGCANFGTVTGDFLTVYSDNTNPRNKFGFAPTAATEGRYKLDQTISCKAAGGAITTISSYSAWFTIDPGEDSPTAPPVECEDGILISGDVWLTPENAEETRQNIWHYEAPDVIKAIPDDMPECVPHGAGEGICLLKLARIAPLPRLDCHISAAAAEACVSWASDPNKADNYECTYGTYVVELVRCDIYKDWFKPKPARKLTPTLGPNGDPVPKPAIGSTTPGTDPTPPEGGLGDCVPQWSDLLTPWWVFKAMTCAMTWAFVPAPGVLEAGWDKADVDWCATAPGVLICATDAIMGPFTEIGVDVDEEDCLGGSVPIPDIRPGHADGEMHPWQACNEAAQQISGFWIPFASGGIYLGAFLGGARMVAKTIGAEDAVI